MKARMQYVVAFVSGLLFAIGLGISGMTDPTKVIGFLDFLGDWQPALAFVMGGAVVVYAIAFPLITGRKMPILAQKFELPTLKDLTPQLIIGSSLFGIGWGLGGFCPGPALTSIATLLPGVFVFILSMLAGMLLYRGWEKISQKAPAPAARTNNAARPGTP